MYRPLEKEEQVAKGTTLYNEAGEILGEAVRRLNEGDRYIVVEHERKEHLLVRWATYVATAQRAVDLSVGDVVYVKRGHGTITTGTVAIVTQVMWNQSRVDAGYDGVYRPDVRARGTGGEFSLFADDVTHVELLKVERTGVEITDEYGKTDGEVHHAREEER